MSAQEIDWSKAPDDATHHAAETDTSFECWLKPGYAVRVSRGAPGWVRNDSSDRFIADGSATERPSLQWSGEGLPPVGTVCEVKFCHWNDWEKAEILCFGAKMVFVRQESRSGMLFEGSMNIDGIEFRPIRTPEQITADEREAAVNAMLLLDPYLPNTQLGMMSRADFCRAIYADGYRKPSERAK